MKKIAVLLFLLATPAMADITIVAGNGEAGFVDGKDARLNKPIRLAPFGPGKILIADINNNAIRIVARNGTVTTIAGGPDKKGHRDGPAEQAMFNGPHGVAVAADGRIAVAGASSHVVRLLTPTKGGYEVSTIAGTVGETGYEDGPADKALFNSPHGLAWDNDGGLLVVDIGNASIRRIKDGIVSTVLGGDTEGMVMPIDLSAAPDGSFLIADAGNGSILRWSGGKMVETVATDNPLKMPHGVAGDAAGKVYVAELSNHEITQLYKGKRTVVGGTGKAGGGPKELNQPAAVLVHDGLIWIADLDNHRISVIPLSE